LFSNILVILMQTTDLDSNAQSGVGVRGLAGSTESQEAWVNHLSKNITDNLFFLDGDKS
jgi:hypothetical protein